MAFDEKKLRLERVSLETVYHAAYQFWNLRGVLPERWAHGPTFNGYRAGPDFVHLTPSTDAEDARLVGAFGLRNAGLVAEGSYWTAGASSLAEKWLADVYKTLEPRRTTRIKAQITALYPTPDPDKVSRNLRGRFYDDEELQKLVPDRFSSFHAAIEGLCVDGDPPMSFVVGVYGPPHQLDGLFTFPDDARDSTWWLCARLVSMVASNEGFDDPVRNALDTLNQLTSDYSRIVRTTFPSLVD